MKKLFYSAIVAVACSVFFSCGNSPANKSDQDSTVTDTLVSDTTLVDTTAALGNASLEANATTEGEVATEGKTHRSGFGRCLESGCYCKEFKGRGKTCRNCGHAYRRHY